MTYFAKNKKDNNNSSNKTPTLKSNGNWSDAKPKFDKKGNWTDSQNGYNNANKFKNNGAPKDGLKEKFENIKYNQKRRAAKKAITQAASAAGPVAGMAAKAAVNTPKGEKYIDAYAKGETPQEGMKNVKEELKKDKRKITIALFIINTLLPLLFLLLILVLVFKNADSQIFSNDNGGTVQSENYIDDDKVINIFANYPGLYENIMKKVREVSDKYQIEIDKYLVIATLVAPISNELIVPVEDHSCGEEKCYYFKGESKTWSEFLKAWSDQAELLSKMQLLTYINNQNDIRVNCGAEETMEQYAQNDLPTNTFPWWGWLNPANWFKGFRDSAASEVNARCVDANNGEYIVPTVRVLSIDQGNYYVTYTKDKQYDFVKDPNSGGVYFWNLINKNGFIHEYLKDYLSSEYSDDPDKNYEINKKTIVETVNYIYSYYQSIRKDCNTYPVIKGELKKVNFREDGSSAIYNLDFEDVFVGGSVLATYGGAKGEVAKAQAILTRSEAYNYIVEQGKDVITGSSKMGCWWWKYNPTYDPSYEDQKDNPNYDPNYPKEHYPEIYKAVTETRGIVVTQYGKTKVLETEYDAFCPTTRDPMEGFYYLPDGQRNLPIEFARFWPQSWSECPCFQNENARPDVEFSESFNKLLNTEVGTPAQTTSAVCWEETGEFITVSTNKKTTENVTIDSDKKILYGYHYEPTGGHGRGVSQHGMAYFAQFGYDYKALIKLFIDRDYAGASFKKYGDSIEVGECENYALFNEKEYE